MTLRSLPKVKKFAAVCLMMLLCILASFSAFAAEDTGSLTYSYPVDGVEFRLYQVGEIRNSEYILTGEFADYPIDLTQKTAAETLSAYIARDGQEPLMFGQTEDGAVRFDGLDFGGLYLLEGDTATVDGVIWTPAAILFSVPSTDDEGNVTTDVTAGGKYTRTETPRTTITVQKIWEDTGFESVRPARVVAQLRRDGELFAAVFLTEDNNWTFTWTGLDPDAVWTVTEVEEEGYTVSIETSGDTVVIVNSRQSTPPTDTPDQPDTPDNPTPTQRIPQTGQLWWPVGILAVVGIACVLIGLIRRERSRG